MKKNLFVFIVFSIAYFTVGIMQAQTLKTYSGEKKCYGSISPYCKETYSYYVGEDGKYLALWSDAGYASFLTSETDKFPDYQYNIYVPANFTAKITAKNGHVELVDIKDVTYEDDYYPGNKDFYLNKGYLSL